MSLRNLLAATICGAAALLPSAGWAQSEPWWNGAPDAPAQKAPAQWTPAPPVPVEPQPQPQLPPPPADPARETGAAAPSAPMDPPAGSPQADPAPYPPAPPVTAQMAAQGEWVFTAQDGWLWVPYGASATTVGVAPYVYLYAPAYGWRWFVSPWGVGPMRYGPWGWGPRWGSRYAPPRGLGGFHSAPRVGGVGGVGRGYRAAPANRLGGALHGFGGGHGGGGHSAGGGHHR